MTTCIEYVYLSVVNHSGYVSHDTSVAGEFQNGEPPSDQAKYQMAMVILIDVVYLACVVCVLYPVHR